MNSNSFIFIRHPCILPSIHSSVQSSFHVFFHLPLPPRVSPAILPSTQPTLHPLLKPPIHSASSTFTRFEANPPWAVRPPLPLPYTLTPPHRSAQHGIKSCRSLGVPTIGYGSRSSQRQPRTWQQCSCSAMTSESPCVRSECYYCRDTDEGQVAVGKRNTETTAAVP